MTKPLTAWWWQKKDNYGDILNPAILRYVARRPVEWAGQGECEVVAIGSVMDAVRRRVRNGGSPVVVWGTGMKDALPADFVEGAVFAAVRGPLTATHLRLDGLPMGDPGLLVDRALDVRHREKTHAYGIIAHYQHRQNEDVRQLADALPRSTIIPMMSGDVLRTTEAIAACEVILSSSLHGLIVADALRIPSLWIDTGPIGDTTRFKFFDYALGVGRDLRHPIAIADILATGVPEADTRHFDGLTAVKDQLERAFPAELAA